MTETSLYFGPFSQSITHLFFTIPHLRSIFVLIIIFSYASLILLAQYQPKSINNSLLKTFFSDRVFIFFSLAILFICRSFYLYQDQLNPDEGMHLTAAINLLASPKLWVSADATTLGPICQILLVLLSFIFGGISYALARITAIIIIGSTFFIFYKALKLNVTTSQARLLAIFYILFMSFGTHLDVQAYNCEVVTNLFLALSLYFIFSIKKGLSNRKVLFLGLSIGLLPYVKLQNLPFVFMLIAWSCFILYKNKPKLILILFASMLLPTLILILYCASYENGISNAILYYLVNANNHLTFTQTGLKFLAPFLSLLIYLISSWYYYVFALIPLSLILVLLFKLKIKQDLIFSLFLLGTALFSILLPLRPYEHYTLLLIIPSLTFCAMLLKAIDRPRIRLPAILVKKTFPALIISLYFFMFISCITSSIITPSTAKFNLVGLNQSKWYDVSKLILSLTDKNDSIVVWGWEERINVYTQLKSATAQNNIERVINWQYSSKNIDHYLEDIKKNRPKVIIDVVAPGSFVFTDSIFSLSNQSKIFPYVEKNYQLYCKIDRGEGNIKVYLRNDAVKASHIVSLDKPVKNCLI